MSPAGSELVGFKRHLRAETVPGEAVYLISERRVTALSGSGIERLAPLLDGTRNVTELTREVSAELAAADVGALIERLSEAGLLDLRPPPAPDPEPDAATAAFWSQAGLDADQAARALRAATVEVVALDQAGDPPAAALCGGSGLAVVPEGAPATVSLVLCGDYLDPRLPGVNARYLASGRPWLLAKPGGAEAWIGPLFQPGAGPCWACLATRLEGNRAETRLLRRVLGTRAFPAAPPASLPASRAAALHLAVAELAKWLAGVRAEGQQAIYILDTLSLHGRHHRVHRRPQCSACGTPGLVAARAMQPPAAAPPPAAAAGPAGTGAVTPTAGPDRVLAGYGHLVDPVTGIVAELTRDERCPRFQHAYASGRNRALSASSVAALRAGSRYVSGGAGSTESEAKTAALCEAIERYCGTRQGDEAVVRDSQRGLGSRAVPPASCLLFDQRQLDDRARWNATCAPFHRVHEPLDADAVTDWTPVWSLLTGEQKLLPTAMLYYHQGSGPRLADSNGCAAGAHLGDAIVRGFLELVERDAVALWWYNRTRQPGLCLRAFGDPWLARLPEEYRRLGREIWALDLTSDLGIPVVAALSRRTGPPAEDIVLGFGAHPDPRRALRRALTELGQALPPVSASADPYLAAWRTHATVDRQAYLLPDPARNGPGPGPGADAGPGSGHGRDLDLDLDLDGVRAVARRAGLDVLVLDQTRPDIGMPVAKVVVPGLRHFWPRFAPGRLFDVPVRLGRLVRPTAYADLNPLPLYV